VNRFDVMDRVAIGAMVALAATILFFVIRGDQVGVQIVRSSPEPNAASVPTRGLLAFTFNEPMVQQSVADRISITPALSGTLRWSGTTAFWASPTSLQPDTTYTVTFAAGATSQRGRQILQDTSIVFTTGHPRLVYLAPADGASNLVIQDVFMNGAPQPITQEQFRIYDFAVSPDGRRIVYSLDREEQNPERDLWIINVDGTGRDLLVRCDVQVCQSPTWAADSTRIAFERRNLIEGAVGRSPGPARIWLVDSITRETAPLTSDEQQIGSLPRFAPIGDKLAFYDQQLGGISVIDTATGEQTMLPSLLGDSGAWSPDANQIIYPELQAYDAGQFSQLLKADLFTNIITAVTPLSATNDGGATWSPLGDRVAFGRQVGAGGRSILGPQVWTMTPDGMDMQQLTDEPQFSHGSIDWSPDGQWLALQRFDLLTQQARPEVWLMRADGSEKRKLADDAILPAWLP
jgi:Tol biopolymer transport system component